MSLLRALTLAVGLAATAMATARDGRVVPTAVAAHETDDVLMPRLSPDGRDVAYAAGREHRGVPVAEIRALRLADGRRRILLPTRVAAEAAVYAAPALSIEWADARRLQVDLGDGDVGYTRYRLEARRGRRLAEAYHEMDFELPPEPAPHWPALVPQWPAVALADALHTGIRHGDGALVQKSHAGEDRHVWWLDPKAGVATPVLRIADLAPTLVGGAPVGGALVFAVTGSETVDLHRLDGTRTRHLATLRLPGEADPAGTPPSHVRLRPLRCTAGACWLALETLRRGAWSSRLLRVGADGDVGDVAGIAPGLAMTDVSRDGRWLAATHRRGDGHRLVVYRITAF